MHQERMVAPPFLELDRFWHIFEANAVHGCEDIFFPKKEKQIL